MMKSWAKTIAGCASGAQPSLQRELATEVMGCGWSRPSVCCTILAICHGLTHMRSATMTYVYAGAADWGGKDPAKCNRGLYRLAMDTGTWTTLERGLPDEVEVRCVTLHPTQPGVVFAGTQAGPYRSTDAGDTWERMHVPGAEPVVWSCEIHPADARVMYVGTQDMAVYRSEDGGEQWRRLTVPTNPDELYAGVEVGGLVRSLDGGATWTDGNAPLLALATQERYTQQHGPRRASEGMMHRAPCGRTLQHQPR